MNQKTIFEKQLNKFLEDKQKESGIKNGHYKKQIDKILDKSNPKSSITK